jgi:Ulp1 family protease
MQVLLRFFRDEWKARHDEDDSGFSNEGWGMINANPPRQTNAVDCGVCVCINTYCVSSDLDLNYAQQDLNRFRYLITSSILRRN